MSPRSGPPFRGRLLETFTASDSTLHICSYPAPPCTSPTQVSAMQRISTASLAGLEVQHGNHLAEGAIIGGLIAGTVFGLLGGIAHSLCESSNCGPSTPGYITIGLVVGGMFGGLIGATSPKWTQAP